MLSTHCYLLIIDSESPFCNPGYRSQSIDINFLQLKVLHFYFCNANFYEVWKWPVQDMALLPPLFIMVRWENHFQFISIICCSECVEFWRLDSDMLYNVQDYFIINCRQKINDLVFSTVFNCLFNLLCIKQSLNMGKLLYCVWINCQGLARYLVNLSLEILIKSNRISIINIYR